MTPKGIERAIKLLEQRGPLKSACPSEIARGIDAAAWRALTPSVHEAAARLAKRGRIDVPRNGKKVDLRQVRGPIRLRRAAAVDVYAASGSRG